MNTKSVMNPSVIYVKNILKPINAHLLKIYKILYNLYSFADTFWNSNNDPHFSSNSIVFISFSFLNINI
jgi:hypothetical protein